ncbi:MAG: Gfo/Idh/MocA family oxidoreductase, partial [Flavobacteriales bacterium]|nr:Gfo/Idh/MocA family oxidoreductase [Flavobacteriales bacterium]
MKSKIKIGVLGCSSFARRSFLPAILLCDKLELHAVASRTKEKAEEFANQFGCKAIVGYENLINDEEVQIVYMPLPTGLHKEWIQKAIAKGKHLLVEKTFAMNYGYAEVFVSLAKENGILIRENFQFQYHAQHEKIKELVLNGTIGELKSMRAAFGYPAENRSDQILNIELGGGALFILGCYTLKVS